MNSSSSAGLQSMSVMSPQGLEVAMTIAKLLPSDGGQMYVDCCSLAQMLKLNNRKKMSSIVQEMFEPAKRH